MAVGLHRNDNARYDGTDDEPIDDAVYIPRAREEYTDPLSMGDSHISSSDLPLPPDAVPLDDTPCSTPTTASVHSLDFLFRGTGHYRRGAYNSIFDDYTLHGHPPDSYALL